MSSELGASWGPQQGKRLVARVPTVGGVEAESKNFEDGLGNAVETRAHGHRVARELPL